MITGMHTVADIFCVGCGSVVGWTYVRLNSARLRNFAFVFCFYATLSYPFGFFQITAHEKSQKYKEGKSVIERLVKLMFEKTFLNVM